jgi:DNA-binding response OmpR family regulator
MFVSGSARKPATVLVVGHESMLRESYAMLFQQAGYVAEEAEVDQSPRRLKSGTFALLVMDHTLSKEERESLVILTRQLSPNAKTVALHSSASDCGADLAMDSREGAEEILKRVGELFSGYSSTH